MTSLSSEVSPTHVATNVGVALAIAAVLRDETGAAEQLAALDVQDVLASARHHGVAGLLRKALSHHPLLSRSLSTLLDAEVRLDGAAGSWRTQQATRVIDGLHRAGVATLVKLAVQRPRPSIDLVDVIRELSTSTFPSGHVLTFTSLCGFLAFLAYTLLKPSRSRTGLLITCSVLIVLMGLSRIYQGHHWFSDVMGAYLLATLWLAISIWAYRWGKPRFFVHQPVAPDAPETGTT